MRMERQNNPGAALGKTRDWATADSANRILARPNPRKARSLSPTCNVCEPGGSFRLRKYLNDLFPTSGFLEGRGGQATSLLDTAEAKQFGEQANDPILFARWF